MIAIEFLRPGARVWVRKEFPDQDHADRFLRRLPLGSLARHAR